MRFVRKNEACTGMYEKEGKSLPYGETTNLQNAETGGETSRNGKRECRPLPYGETTISQG